MAKHFTYSKGIVYRKDLLTSITSTTTSNAELCAGAKAITLFFTGASLTDRTGTLTVEISPDGTNFYAYNMLLDNVANSNSEELTRVSSKARSSNGTDILFFTPETLGAIAYFRVKVTVSDGASPAGNFTVKAIIQY